MGSKTPDYSDGGWWLPCPVFVICSVGELFYTDTRHQICQASRLRGALSRRVAMSQAGHFRQYAEEREPPRLSPWKFSPPVHASEYHLIDLSTGVSHGGFATLTGARQMCPRKRSGSLGHLPWQCSGRVPRAEVRATFSPLAKEAAPGKGRSSAAL